MTVVPMEPDYIKLKPVKPAIAGYIRESQILLKDPDIVYETAVHDIRVLMKKARVVLKLVAHQTDNPFYDRDTAELKEVGRILSCFRDTSVQRKIMKSYKKEFPDIFYQLRDNPNLNVLLEKHDSLVNPPEKIKEALNETDILLGKTGYRIRFQSMNSIDPHLLLKELDSSYTIVSDLYLKCRNNTKPKNLHRFRQKAKDFLYQLYIFRPLNPSVIKVLEKKLENMTQNLGKFNDLNQIVGELDYNYQKGANLPALDELILMIRDMQDKYLTRVWATSYQVFCPGKNLVNVLGFKLLVI